MAWCGVIVQIDRSHSANRHSLKKYHSPQSVVANEASLAHLSGGFGEWANHSTLLTHLPALTQPSVILGADAFGLGSPRGLPSRILSGALG